jgi:hypothetical protein
MQGLRSNVRGYFDPLHVKISPDVRGGKINTANFRYQSVATVLLLNAVKGSNKKEIADLSV